MFNLAIVLLFISGAAVVLYPAVSDMWNSQWNNQMKSIYDKSVNLYWRKRSRTSGARQRHTMHSILLIL